MVNVATGGASTGGCTAADSKVIEWPGGFQGQVTVTNSGSMPAAGWSVVSPSPLASGSTRSGWPHDAGLEPVHGHQRDLERHRGAERLDQVRLPR
ncbi:MAG: cellulose binding domain-containing protein [Micromonosporaceae bacterium]|nr:cellulose binding domain-containing protein [Micromonosporaceae bacterium]